MASFHIRKVANKVGLAWCNYPLQSVDDRISDSFIADQQLLIVGEVYYYDGPTFQLINNKFLASKELWSGNYWLNFGNRAHIRKTFFRYEMKSSVNSCAHIQNPKQLSNMAFGYPKGFSDCL